MSGFASNDIASSSVRMGKRVHTLVKQYSDITGVPISRVVDNALEDWLSTVGAARVEILKRDQTRKENAQLLTFPSVN